MNKKIRVLHYGLSNNLGGIETYMYKIASHIDRNRFQFDYVIADDGIPPFIQELQELGCKILVTPHRRKGLLSYIRSLRRILKNGNYDIVHCHMNSLSNAQIYQEALRAGCKVLIHSHNGQNPPEWHSALLHKIGQFMLPKRKITAVAVSDIAGEWMFGKGSQYTVLNNGLDTGKYTYSPAFRSKIRKEFNISDETELILNVGQFRTQKNHTRIVEIFAAYLKLNPSAILMLVGKGELENQIRQKIKDLNIENNVIFTGNRPDVIKILSAADKFLFPSLFEGFPCALIEAETSGLACLSSDTITKQVMIDGLCQSVPLNAEKEIWADALLKLPCAADRSVYADKIKKMGLGIDAEMKRLTDVYDSMSTPVK